MNELSQIILATLCALSICGFLADIRWYFDLCSHFRVQYIALAFALVIYYAVVAQYPSLAISLALLALNIYAIRAEFALQSDSVDGHPGENISVLMANVLTSNTKHDMLHKLISDTQPDVIGLVEVDRPWLEGLKPALINYREKFELARDDNFGLALYAKYPVQKSAVVFFGDVGIPSIAVTLNKNGRSVDIILTHTMPPVGAKFYHIRNAHLKGLAQQRSHYAEQLIVMGDFNITPWNAVYREFINASGLNDTRAGKGLLRSWPVWNPLLMIPIDHILVSPRVHVLKRGLGPHIGSDHYPVYAELKVF